MRSSWTLHVPATTGRSTPCGTGPRPFWNRCVCGSTAGGCAWPCASASARSLHCRCATPAACCRTMQPPVGSRCRPRASTPDGHDAGAEAAAAAGGGFDAVLQRTRAAFPLHVGQQDCCCWRLATTATASARRSSVCRRTPSRCAGVRSSNMWRAQARLVPRCRSARAAWGGKKAPSCWLTWRGTLKSCDRARSEDRRFKRHFLTPMGRQTRHSTP